VVRRGGTSAVSPSQQSRAQSRARRSSLAKAGRRAETSTDRTRTADLVRGAKPAAPEGERKGCGCGCNGSGKCGDKAQNPSGVSSGAAAAPFLGGGLSGNDGASRVRRKQNGNLKSSSRLVALARRKAQSTRGKGAGDNATSAAGLARQANPRLSSRELSQKVREQRSRNGSSGARKTPSAGQIRAARRKGAAADQPWKVGASETVQGQLVTGTNVSRSLKTTGDEASTCRTITGTEYMGAEIFREFCQAEPQPGTRKVAVTSTGGGNPVTGNEVGRSPKVTGDEPGTCKNVTGTAYLSAEQQDAYCGIQAQPAARQTGLAQTVKGKQVSGTLVGRSGKVTGDEHGAGIRPTGTQYTDAQSIQNGRVDTDASARIPPKVGSSVTLSGGVVTGTRVGRSERVTGDEPGSCRIVTGDEYADREQYQAFCGTEPSPEPSKVGLSTTNKRQKVSGTQTGRSAKVTGDEPGTCKAVTGTPYAGLEQAADYCDTGAQGEIQARTRSQAATPGPRMTGIQPGIGGAMTGADKGACEPLTGTPYVGQDQFAAACGGSGAAPGDADFPQTLEQPAVGQAFSVQSPARQAFQAAANRSAVTGTRYETGNQITGPFDMAVGKITGTEQFRFDARRQPQVDLTAPAPVDEAPAARPSSRITGEGQSAGLKITGDDWDRGERVTGTEGASARRRNPTRPGGPMSAMKPVEPKRNDEVPAPVSRVTGASGNTERGAMITYSGGARG
jgi:hypothetical protein